MKSFIFVACVFAFAGQILAKTYPLPSADDDIIGEVRYIDARYEDTLADIARDNDLGYEEILAANPEVDPWLPGAGTRITIPSRFILPPGPRKGIVINLSEMRLYYFHPKREVVITHPIGIGREGFATPIVTTKIIAKMENPTWHVPESVRKEYVENNDYLPKVVPPGPKNPLGTHAFRLAIPSYMLHGTNDPYGVGMRVSHGCIRMYPEDVKTFYTQVPVGTGVRIINQAYKIGRQDGVLYAELHPPLAEELKRNGGIVNLTPLISALESIRTKQNIPIDWSRVEELARDNIGIPIAVSTSEEDPNPH